MRTIGVIAPRNIFEYPIDTYYNTESRYTCAIISVLSPHYNVQHYDNLNHTPDCLLLQHGTPFKKRFDCPLVALEKVDFLCDYYISYRRDWTFRCAREGFVESIENTLVWLPPIQTFVANKKRDIHHSPSYPTYVDIPLIRQADNIYRRFNERVVISRIQSYLDKLSDDVLTLLSQSRTLRILPYLNYYEFLKILAHSKVFIYTTEALVAYESLLQETPVICLKKHFAPGLAYLDEGDMILYDDCADIIEAIEKAMDLDFQDAYHKFRLVSDKVPDRLITFIEKICG